VAWFGVRSAREPASVGGVSQFPVGITRKAPEMDSRSLTRTLLATITTAALTIGFAATPTQAAVRQVTPPSQAVAQTATTESGPAPVPGLSVAGADRAALGGDGAALPAAVTGWRVYSGPYGSYAKCEADGARLYAIYRGTHHGAWSSYKCTLTLNPFTCPQRTGIMLLVRYVSKGTGGGMIADPREISTTAC
jgi:hypothetical protein